MKKTNLLLLAFLLFLLLPFTVRAFEIKTSNSVVVEETEVIEGSLYAAGSEININGQINGDLICAGGKITINGKISGDIICAGQEININNTVGGNVRAAGETINLTSSTTKNVTLFGSIINFSPHSFTGGEVLLFGAEGDLNGEIVGDLHGMLSILKLNGTVRKNVNFKFDERIEKEIKGIKYNDDNPIQIGEKAKIEGNLFYTSKKEGRISENAEIKGEVKHHRLEDKNNKNSYFILGSFKGLFSVFSALVVGLVLISLFRGRIISITDHMIENIGASAGWGILILFLTPIIIFILIITLIGIPLSLILVAIWLMAIYLSKIITAILVGRSIVEKIWTKKKDSLIWSMILGIIISWFIFSLPFLGWLLSLIAIFWGLGGIWTHLKQSE